MRGTIGERVRRRRKAQGLTQVQLAARAKIGQSALSSIETGDTRWLRGGNLLRLAVALEVSPHWLETGEGDPTERDELADAALIDVWAALTQENRRAWLNAGRGMVAGQPKRSPDADDPFPAVPRPAKSTRHS